MSAPPDDQGACMVAMALRVKGRASAAVLAAATGLAAGEVIRRLEAARSRGAVEAVAGERWTLTAAGRTDLERGLALERAAREALAGTYARFLDHDAALKAGITAWQHERTPIGLAAVHAVGAAARTLVPALVALIPRYRAYAARLDRALAAIAGGDARFVAHPGVDSLHQVWFELHEDLLVVLERSRAS